MEKLNTRMQKIILWVTSYASIVALVLCGGYVLCRSEDKEVKKTAVQAFIVNAIFLGISAFLSLLSYLLVSLCHVGDYVSANSILTALVAIARIIVYAVMVIMLFVKKEDSTGTQNS